MKYIFYTLALIVGLIATGFSILNSQQVNLHFYFATFSASLSLVILLGFFMGILLGIAVFLPKSIKLRYSNRKLRQIARDYESEIRTLRTFPIQDNH
jgi:putative membrane protein